MGLQEPFPQRALVDVCLSAQSLLEPLCGVSRCVFQAMNNGKREFPRRKINRQCLSHFVLFPGDVQQIVHDLERGADLHAELGQSLDEFSIAACGMGTEFARDGR